MTTTSLLGVPCIVAVNAIAPNTTLYSSWSSCRPPSVIARSSRVA